MWCCYRPGSVRVDAFRGHGLSLLEKTTLRGLRTRAISAGVTTLLSPGLVKLFTEKLFVTSSAKEFWYKQTLYQQHVYTKASAGGKASMRRVIVGPVPKLT